MPKTLPNATALEPAVVILDACVLYPFHLRNILVQIAADRLMEARWTDAIQQEWSRNLLAALPNLSDGRLKETQRLMDKALPQARVLVMSGSSMTSTCPTPMIVMLWQRGWPPAPQSF